MILYHFTDRDHLSAILRDNEITVQNWFPDPKVSIVSFPIVWLTRDPYKHNHAWLRDKTIRFTVDVKPKNVSRWDAFALKKSTMRAYNNSLNIGAPETWYVCENSIPREQWREITLLTNDGKERERIQIHSF